MLRISDSKFKDTADLLHAVEALLSTYDLQNFNDFLEKNKRKSKSLQAKKIPATLNDEEKKILDLAKLVATNADILSNMPSSTFYFYDKIDKNKSKFVKLYIFSVNEESAFSEAFLVYLFDLMLKKFFKSDALLSFNSLGDKDSATKYIIDLKRYLRKNKKFLPDKILKDFNENKIKAIAAKMRQAKHPALDEAPCISDYLTDNAQRHLYKFLDYMESMGIRYELDPQLFGNDEIWKHLVIHLGIYNDSSKDIVAYGGRVNNALYALCGKEMNMSAIIVEIEKKGRKVKVPAHSGKLNKKVYFIQIGLMAKSQAVKMIDELQDAGFSVGHNISEMSLIEQYRLAVNYGAKYAVILGHKEAINNTVILRNIETQTQKIVAQKDLLKKLKKLK